MSLIGIALAVYFFYFHPISKKISINNQEQKAVISSPAKQSSLFIAGWLPYWKKKEGIISLEGNISSFSEINPFSFEVDEKGRLVNAANIGAEPWTGLFNQAKRDKVSIVPTILWTDEVAMHQVFADPQRLGEHVAAIETMLERYNFSGVDIDYEGKSSSDRELFTVFLEALKQRLSLQDKNLTCTVEARSDDQPPTDWTEVQAMSYANDYSALNRICDSVRIMAYDQMFQTNGMKKSFETVGDEPSLANAGIDWVEQVMRYSLQFIQPEKLVMGVPTYGWEFYLTKTDNGYRYARIRSISYPDAIQLAKDNSIVPQRNSGGELSFIYSAKDGRHIVVVSDAEEVRQKIELARELNIRGISLFKIDGAGDPEIFSTLKMEIVQK